MQARTIVLVRASTVVGTLSNWFYTAEKSATANILSLPTPFLSTRGVSVICLATVTVPMLRVQKLFWHSLPLSRKNDRMTVASGPRNTWLDDGLPTYTSKVVLGLFLIVFVHDYLVCILYVHFRRNTFSSSFLSSHSHSCVHVVKVKSTPNLESSISYLLKHVRGELSRANTASADCPEVLPIPININICLHFCPVCMWNLATKPLFGSGDVGVRELKPQPQLSNSLKLWRRCIDTRPLARTSIWVYRAPSICSDPKSIASSSAFVPRWQALQRECLAVWVELEHIWGLEWIWGSLRSC